MPGVLRHRAYRHLFAAQVVALVGTGLATVALGLLAFDIAGGSAGAVVGTALTIKMVAYVAISPFAGAAAGRVPRRAMLVALDLVRGGVAVCLPFVDAVWQVYLLIFVLQAASAAFTPTFQATIPDVLPDERDYTRALSLSRLAYDLESLFSPMLAAALLTVVGYQQLFAGTAVGFAASALLVVSVLLPKPAPASRREPVLRRTTLGMRIFAATPRLRALLAMNLAVAAATSMVLVNTVVIVREQLGRSESDVAVALGCYGAGSMVVALLLPRVLDRVGDRAVMLPAGFLLAAVLGGSAAALALAPAATGWWVLLAAWTLLGAGTSLVLTPSSRLLRRSAGAADRPALFAAQFSLSHAGFLAGYPVAGWLGVTAGMPVTLAVLGAAALAAGAAAALLWPSGDPVRVAHVHRNLAPGHPHLVDARSGADGGRAHTHDYVIDDEHPRWPRRSDAPLVRSDA
ncbi:MFS transporter [Marinitenerispora sediminis]|uniref:MFS transporter n=1 Tax=Marinitenerispora sediminis TaxID=1931232 RepID=A0A368T9B5_9ACTN|nr:MFS transporter [Marinitenerispora sediminis]RCV58101.1 MFS transporter [Marinitenerispora sediminis]RCV60864.1 MFS transporter [Marinitenerispora sediminis]